MYLALILRRALESNFTVATGRSEKVSGSLFDDMMFQAVRGRMMDFFLFNTPELLFPSLDRERREDLKLSSLNQ